MKKNIHKLILAVFVVTILFSCTPNETARQYGGTEIIELEKGEKFINCTWKENNIWYLVQVDTNTFEFREKSEYGVMEGKIIFKRK